MKTNNIHPKTEFLEKQYKDTMQIVDEVDYCCGWCGEELIPKGLTMIEGNTYTCNSCNEDSVWTDGLMVRYVEVKNWENSWGKGLSSELFDIFTKPLREIIGGK